jgi:hypothetical protein
MHPRTRLTAIAASVLLAVPLATVVPTLSAGAQSPGVPRTAAQEAGAGAVPAGCATTAGPGHAHCYLALERAAVPPPTATTAACPVNEAGGYSACNIQGAYGLKTLSKKDGKGNTVAVVDAYDDPNAAKDLNVYRSDEHLSKCTTANGCFKKVNQEGTAKNYPNPSATWAGEISLDLDMVSAVCPNCHILLVEANSNGFGTLATAVNEAVSLGARAVSDSWGSGEFGGETGWDGDWDHPGVAITFSSGDGAYQAGVQYPSASPYVTSVGGTELTPSSNSRGWTEVAWSNPTSGSPPKQGSGSGCSAYEPKPPWQTDKACTRRTTADVSAVAANVLSYDTYATPPGWYYSFGTSVASPIIAATYGLADNPPNNSTPASAIYAAPAGDLHDITSGSTGTCTPPSRDKYLCTAVKSYDGPTGRGTPKGIGAFIVTGGTTPPSISSVSFSGTSAAPTVTVSGANFGAFPPFGQAAGCTTSGQDYGTTGLNFTDNTGGWEAGHAGDCIGLSITSWSSSSVTFGFGSGYATYAALANGNGYSLEVDGTTFSGTVSGLSA